MYWEPAESGSQQTVGRSRGLLACFCEHADEAVSGTIGVKPPLQTKPRHLSSWLLMNCKRKIGVDEGLSVGCQSDRASEGADGPTEGHGGHVAVSA